MHPIKARDPKIWHTEREREEARSVEWSSTTCCDRHRKRCVGEGTSFESADLKRFICQVLFVTWIIRRAEVHWAVFSSQRWRGAIQQSMLVIWLVVVSLIDGGVQSSSKFVLRIRTRRRGWERLLLAMRSFGRVNLFVPIPIESIDRAMRVLRERGLRLRVTLGQGAQLAGDVFQIRVEACRLLQSTVETFLGGDVRHDMWLGRCFCKERRRTIDCRNDRLLLTSIVMQRRVRIVFSQQRFVVVIVIRQIGVALMIPNWDFRAIHAGVRRQRIGMIRIVQKIDRAQWRGHLRPGHVVPFGSVSIDTGRRWRASLSGFRRTLNDVRWALASGSEEIGDQSIENAASHTNAKTD